jgi:hypothetical protein
MFRNLRVFTLLVTLAVFHAAVAGFSLVSPYSSSRTRTTNIFASVDDDDDDDDDVSLEGFQARKNQQQQAPQEGDEEFDGYVLRDILLEKWGKAYDVDFNKVEHLGTRNLYLNVMPFHLGSRTFRHESELDYLCHLQAVVEILLKYNQVSVPYVFKHAVPQLFLSERLTSNKPLQIGNVLIQIDETKKKPRAGTSPLIAVPLRLDLTPDQVTEIIGN